MQRRELPTINPPRCSSASGREPADVILDDPLVAVFVVEACATEYSLVSCAVTAQNQLRSAGGPTCGGRTIPAHIYAQRMSSRRGKNQKD